MSEHYNTNKEINLGSQGHQSGQCAVCTQKKTPATSPDEKLSSRTEAHEEEGASAQELYVGGLQPGVVTVGNKMETSTKHQ